MLLLPSEQKKRTKEAIERFEKTGELDIFEPCDCGSNVRHNTGGNYHEKIYIRRDEGSVYVKYGTTCKLVPPNEWEECKDYKEVIKTHADWL